MVELDYTSQAGQGRVYLLQMSAKNNVPHMRRVESARLVDLLYYSWLVELAKLIWASFFHVTRIG